MNRIGRPGGMARALCAIALLTLSAGAARAQGLYYKEVHKDGRIYVFNVAANAERFETSGEMTAAVTKPDAGPGGETVIGDSPRALQLFFFKHGIAEVVPEPPAAPPPYKFSGLVFGDYYAFARHHLPQWDGQHGLWLRRVYFTYDHTWTPKLSTRFRFEINSNGKLEGGALTPYVKDASLRWNFHGRQALTLGIQPSLTFDYLESVWGLRHIEKTPLDLYRWDSSRDTGVTLSGPIGSAQTVKYALQFGNESGNNAETDVHKAFRAAARYEPKAGLTAEVMLSQFQRARDADRTTAQVFAAYRAERGRAGLQYALQRRRAAAGSPAPDVDLDIVSGFGVFDLTPGKVSAFVRADYYADPCADCAGIDYLPIATSHPFTMTLAGIEYHLHPSVRFSPNVEWVTYRSRAGATAPTPEDDTVARLTFYWFW